MQFGIQIIMQNLIQTLRSIILLDVQPYLPEQAGGKEGLKKGLPAKAGKERRIARLCKKIWSSRSSKKIWAGMLLIAIAAAATDYFNEAPLVHEPWAIGHRAVSYTHLYQSRTAP